MDKKIDLTKAQKFGATDKLEQMSCDEFHLFINQSIQDKTLPTDKLVLAIDHTRICQSCANYFLEKMKKS